MTMPWSAMRKICCACCSTIKTAVPSSSRMRMIVSKICVTSIGASPIEGSSINRRRGLSIRAIPNASICRSPPESAPAFCVLRSRRIGNRPIASLLRAASTSDPSVYPPIRRFSKTVRSRNTRAPCGTKAIPAAIFCGGVDRLTSAWSKRIVPSRFGPNPNTARNTVDLPAPFGPITAAIRRSGSIMSMPKSTCFLP